MLETDLDCWGWLMEHSGEIDPDAPPTQLLRPGLEEAMAAMKAWTQE